MDLTKIIDLHNSGQEYKKEDIKTFISGYTDGSIDDELMTKFIKSIYDNGLSIERTADMTMFMMHSGEVIDLSSINGVKVDKHSTGGVGDKVSLIVTPIVAALGGVVAKMSGRGLGFTGGTLDKLESIPGYRIELTDEEFINNVNKNGLSLIGQSKNIVPADKKIYALRDETNLIGSMPLIASSIMSKKLATGSDAILLDVKCGDAAFMKTQKDAEELASWMIKLGKALGRDVRAEITSMDTPLGKSIGNKNEVLEAVRFLNNEEVPTDLKEVIFSSASTMLVQGKIFKTEAEALPKIKEVIENGKALDKFKTWIKSQGGDVDLVFDPEFWLPEKSAEIFAQKDGYFKVSSAITFGIVAMKIGAGREKKEDNIDFEAGIELEVKSGDLVSKGDLLFTMYSSSEITKENVAEIEKAYTIETNKFEKKTLLNKM